MSDVATTSWNLLPCFGHQGRGNDFNSHIFSNCLAWSLTRYYTQ